MQIVFVAHLRIRRHHPRRAGLAPTVSQRGQRGRPMWGEWCCDRGVRVAVGRDGVRRARQTVHVAYARRRGQPEKGFKVSLKGNIWHSLCLLLNLSKEISKIILGIMKIARHSWIKTYISNTYVTWIKLVAVCKVLVWLELFPPLRKSVSNEV